MEAIACRQGAMDGHAASGTEAGFAPFSQVPLQTGHPLGGEVTEQQTDAEQ
jgi:hypothetical protein